MHENYDLGLLMELVRERRFRQLRELLDEMNEVDVAEFLSWTSSRRSWSSACCPRTRRRRSSPIWRRTRRN